MKSFKKFIKESQDDQKSIKRGEWYHGTNLDFDDFDIQYKATVTNKKSATALFFSRSKSFAKGYGRKLYTVKLSPKKVFDGEMLFNGDPDYDTLTKLGMEVLEAYEKEYGEVGYEWFNYIAREDYDIIENPVIQRVLKKNKFDAFFVTGDGERNLGITDPSKIEILEIK